MISVSKGRLVSHRRSKPHRNQSGNQSASAGVAMIAMMAMAAETTAGSE
jgi:hypothetical protein